MINGNSASASEFFTNAIQDYNRGIIIGNKSHGKASMQPIYPIGDEKEPSEYLKITIERFYRITGQTNQAVGILPNIEIPTLFDKQMSREEDNYNALDNGETIEAKLKYQVEANEYASAIEKASIVLKKIVQLKLFLN